MDTKIITVFSNKGGVGKTFVTVNMAAALALSRYKVLLVDFDFQAAQEMMRMLNVTPKKTLVDIFPFLEMDQEEEIIQKHAVRHASGLDFLPVVKNTQQVEQLTKENIKSFIKKAGETYDYVLIDTGKFLSEILITVFDYSNLILLVGTPDILAVYQIKWSLDVLKGLKFPLKLIKLVLNRSESQGSFAWQQVRAALPCDIFSHIPSDGKAVGLALNRGVPSVMDNPKSDVAKAFYQMVKIFNKDDIFIPSMEIEGLRSMGNITQPGQFWEKFGIFQPSLQHTSENFYASKEDEMAAFKRKVHGDLVERLNLDGVTIEILSDPLETLKLKKMAEEVVGSLLLEAAGGLISSHEERQRIVNEIVSEALGLGPLEDLLADPDITDIMVNHKNEIYVEKHGKLYLTDKKFVSDEKMRAIIDRIIAPLGRRIDESTPMVDARLPDGSRINAIIPPLSLNGPMITIRKFGQERLNIKDLLNKFNSLTQDMADFLLACVTSRKNIIVSGGTGAGKTTLLNVLSEFIPVGERIITIEDAAELKLKQTHWSRLEARPSNVEGKGQVTIRDLFVNSLRMRPDRIVIGECRGGEVLDMLQAMNTGHDGSMSTIHANTPKDVVMRLHSLILLSGIELPDRSIAEMIASAIDIVVQINRFSDGTRKVTGISEIIGITPDYQIDLKEVFIFDTMGIDKEGKVLGEFRATGYVPKCYKDFVVSGLDIKENIFSYQEKK